MITVNKNEKAFTLKQAIYIAESKNRDQVSTFELECGLLLKYDPKHGTLEQ